MKSDFRHTLHRNSKALTGGALDYERRVGNSRRSSFPGILLGASMTLWHPERGSSGCVSAIDSNGRTIWIADAHRGHGKHFIVHAQKQLAALLELATMICTCGKLP
jgi:hypothetical protein